MRFLAVSSPTYRPIVTHSEKKPASIGMTKIGFIAQSREILPQVVEIKIVLGRLVLHHFCFHIRQKSLNLVHHFLWPVNHSRSPTNVKSNELM